MPRHLLIQRDTPTVFTLSNDMLAKVFSFLLEEDGNAPNIMSIIDNSDESKFEKTDPIRYLNNGHNSNTRLTLRLVCRRFNTAILSYHYMLKFIPTFSFADTTFLTPRNQRKSNDLFSELCSNDSLEDFIYYCVGKKFTKTLNYILMRICSSDDIGIAVKKLANFAIIIEDADEEYKGQTIYYALVSAMSVERESMFHMAFINLIKYANNQIEIGFKIGILKLLMDYTVKSPKEISNYNEYSYRMFPTISKKIKTE